MGRVCGLTPRGVTPLEMQEAIFYLLEEHSDELEQYMTTSYELKI